MEFLTKKGPRFCLSIYQKQTICFRHLRGLCQIWGLLGGIFCEICCLENFSRCIVICLFSIWNSGLLLLEFEKLAEKTQNFKKLKVLHNFEIVLRNLSIINSLLPVCLVGYLVSSNFYWNAPPQCARNHQSLCIQTSRILKILLFKEVSKKISPKHSTNFARSPTNYCEFHKSVENTDPRREGWICKIR